MALFLKAVDVASTDLASPCAPVPGLRSDKARSLARASERKTVLSRLSLPS